MHTRASNIMLAGILVLSGGAALAASADTAASTAADTAQTMGEAQTGVWTPKETKFVYQGFTTKYSCDSLSDLVEGVLRQLGARRSDLKVRRTGCTESNKPSPFPGTDIKMSVLQPAPAGAPASDGVPAHWKLVNVRLNNDISNASGECELIEQLRQKILPLFTTRNVDSRTDCIPHQLSVGRPTLKVEVLMPDAQPLKKS